MDRLVAAIAQHGYSILFILVFIETIGLPVPAAVALLVAGGAAATGHLQVAASLLTAISAMLIGDTLMYVLGRHTGWWLLGLLCRLSVSPDSCILRSADTFYKRGRVVLVFAKFVPGINALAPPLAGSMRMRMHHFLAFDLAGASLYTFVYWGAGYLFSDFLGLITVGYTHFAGYITWSMALLLVIYLGYRARLSFKERSLGRVATITAPELARKRARVIVFDVRSHGYYQKNTMRIEGSARLEPNALNREIPLLPKDKEIVLYCTCLHEATSSRVARVLTEQGFSVAVIAGGLRAWKKAGLPMEPVPLEEVVLLPTFS
jgi:membrane protein DedA with SNARE-associated domain/rhodanese-related sulfurtransferase